MLVHVRVFYRVWSICRSVTFLSRQSRLFTFICLPYLISTIVNNVQIRPMWKKDSLLINCWKIYYSMQTKKTIRWISNTEFTFIRTSRSLNWISRKSPDSLGIKFQANKWVLYLKNECCKNLFKKLSQHTGKKRHAFLVTLVFFAVSYFLLNVTVVSKITLKKD